MGQQPGRCEPQAPARALGMVPHQCMGEEDGGQDVKAHGHPVENGFQQKGVHGFFPSFAGVTMAWASRASMVQGTSFRPTWGGDVNWVSSTIQAPFCFRK